MTLERFAPLAVALALGLTACAKKSPEPAAPAAAKEPAAARERNTPPPAGSPLARVAVGMTPREVEKTVGVPDDENAYVTGKAFIPFYYGRDRTRRAYFYKDQGRVVFEGAGGFGQSWKVVRVEYDPKETGHAK